MFRTSPLLLALALFTAPVFAQSSVGATPPASYPQEGQALQYQQGPSAPQPTDGNVGPYASQGDPNGAQAVPAQPAPRVDSEMELPYAAPPAVVYPPPYAYPYGYGYPYPAFGIGFGFGYPGYFRGYPYSGRYIGRPGFYGGYHGGFHGGRR